MVSGSAPEIFWNTKCGMYTVITLSIHLTEMIIFNIIFNNTFFFSHLQKTGLLETSLTIWRVVCQTKTSVPLKPSPRRQCLPQDLSMRPMPPRSLQVKGQGHPHCLVWHSPKQTWWVHKYLFPKFLKICKPWWFIKDFPSYLVIFYTFWA